MPNDINFSHFQKSRGNRSFKTPAKGSVYFVLAVVGFIALLVYLILGQKSASPVNQVDLAWKWEAGKDLEYNLIVTYRGDPIEVKNYTLNLQSSKKDTLIKAFIRKSKQEHILTGLTWNPDLSLPAFYITTQRELQTEVLALTQALLTLKAKAVNKEVQEVISFPDYYTVGKRQRAGGKKSLRKTGIITAEIQLDTEADPAPGTASVLLNGSVASPSGTKWFAFKSKIIYNIKKQNIESCISKIFNSDELIYSVSLQRKKDWVRTASKWHEGANQFTQNYNELQKQLGSMPIRRTA